mmetsp:Transcript_71144/g.212148  ORF Transcript_71144/g.212148 Transcript_71144/m.212148 type:complete len:313 (-) Transcript_71144:195-1133(-)
MHSVVVVLHPCKHDVQLLQGQRAHVLGSDSQVGNGTLPRQRQKVRDLREVREGDELVVVEVRLVRPVERAAGHKTVVFLVEDPLDELLAFMEVCRAVHLDVDREAALPGVAKPRVVQVPDGVAGMVQLIHRLHLEHGVGDDDAGGPMRGLLLPKVQERRGVDAEVVRPEQQGEGVGHDRLLRDEDDLDGRAAEVQGANAAGRGDLPVRAEVADQVVHREPAVDPLLLAGGHDRKLVFEEEGAPPQAPPDALEHRLTLPGGQEPHARRGSEVDGQHAPLVLGVLQGMLGVLDEGVQRCSSRVRVQGERGHPRG